jgi:cation diffusion facilitator family transporter
MYLTAYYLTNVLVLRAEALHTLSDVLISSFLLLAVYWSKKPADEYHMFGHGRAQNIAALVAATIFISFMSLETFREAIPKLFQATGFNNIQNINLAYIVPAIGMIVVAVPLIDILRMETRGVSLKTQMVALVKDEVSKISAIIGIFLTSQGYGWADPLASMFVGIVIALGGAILFKDNFHYLVGRAPNREFMEKVESIALSVNGVLGVHDVRAEYVGPDVVHTGFHIEVAKGTTVEEADRISEEVKRDVSRETGCKYCVIHIDPL